MNHNVDCSEDTASQENQRASLVWCNCTVFFVRAKWCDRRLSDQLFGYRQALHHLFSSLCCGATAGGVSFRSRLSEGVG